MGRAESWGLFEPDYSASPSIHDSSDAEGASDNCPDIGPPVGRARVASHGYADAALQSMRDSFVGKRLADCPPLGADSTGSSFTGPSGGARDGRETRVKGGKAKGVPEESGERKGQIGTRQRTRPLSGKVREPAQDSARPEGRQSTEGQSFQESPKGYVQREGDKGPSRSSRPEERGASPRKGGPRSKSGRSNSPREGREEPDPKRGRFLEEKAREVEEKERKGKRKGENPPARVRPRSRSPAGGSSITSGKVREVMEWLLQNGGDHLTAAQMSQYLVIQAVTLNGSFGRLLENSLKPPWDQGVRHRNLMPLPLWPDVIDVLQETIMVQKYRDQPGDWRWRGETKTKASRALRMQGLLLWHGLVVVSLNWLHSEGSLLEGAGPPAGRASAQQEAALNRIWDLVKVFVDDKPEKGGVPRTPTWEWEHELGKLKVSYTGEVVEKAQPLTLEQILPGLPTPHHGGLVDILEVVDERLKKKLLRPDLLRREVFEQVPKPQVMCDEGEWPKVVKAMYDRHLVIPVSTRPVVRGEPVLNGAFGVIKPDKFTDTGLPVLRMIIDLRASNTILEQLEGDRCVSLSEVDGGAR